MKLSSAAIRELGELFDEKKTRVEKITFEVGELFKERDQIMDELKSIVAILKTQHIVDNTAEKAATVTQLPLPNASSSSEPSRGKKAHWIIEVLRENVEPMKSAEIRAVLERRGTPINQNTFDALMSKMMKEPEKWHIFKPQYGYYQYREMGKQP